MSHSRRGFLKAAALIAAGGVAPLSFTRSAAGSNFAPLTQTVRLGVASYSLRKFSRGQAIRMVRDLGTPWLNVKSFHLDYDATPEDFARARKEFAEAGIQVVGGGTITFKEDTDAEVGRYFEYAKNAGMPLMVITGHPNILPRIERFVQRYDIKAAIHNHGPEDEHYPGPADALKHIRNMDPRVGLCIDVGHTVRTSADVVQAIADAGPRLLDVHLKDLADLSDKESQVNVGRGRMPIPDIFRQLLSMNYQGYANLEYEINENDPLPGMAESFAYMRGVLAGLGSPAKIIPAAPAPAG